MILILSSLTTAAILVVEHVVLWRKPWRLGRIPAFFLGTFTIGLGLSLWALGVDNTDAAEAYWCITGAGALAVGIAYWVRSKLGELDARAFAAGQVAGGGDGGDATDDAQQGAGGA